MEYCADVILLLVCCHLNYPEVSTVSSELEKPDSWSDFYVPQPLVATIESSQDHHTFTRQNLGIGIHVCKDKLSHRKYWDGSLSSTGKTRNWTRSISMVLAIKELCWKTEQLKILISMHTWMHYVQFLKKLINRKTKCFNMNKLVAI